MVVSSANRINSRIFEVFVMSLTYSLYNNGPNIKPYGTPHKFFLKGFVRVIKYKLFSIVQVIGKPSKYTLPLKP